MNQLDKLFEELYPRIMLDHVDDIIIGSAYFSDAIDAAYEFYCRVRATDRYAHTFCKFYRSKSYFEIMNTRIICVPMQNPDSIRGLEAPVVIHYLGRKVTGQSVLRKCMEAEEYMKTRARGGVLNNVSGKEYPFYGVI